ncbi:hypothetical protein [Pseudoxanthomonas kalamensis]|uniref:hypothetical protein n=1 Tax=Pseudoxanthomonas kalamensis TaxID=289483 RepID=UPI0013910761|nr:hypothetical protein [Pseudoxanthomonas kalamensis]
MDSWWLVAASVLICSLLVVLAIAATAYFNSMWPLSLSTIALLLPLSVVVARDIRNGKTHPVSHKQQRNHRLVIGSVLVVGLVVIWLAR